MMSEPNTICLIIFQGRTSCVGRDLALTDIRAATARLFSDFRVRFAPGDGGEAVERDMRDQQTANPGNLTLTFQRR